MQALGQGFGFKTSARRIFFGFARMISFFREEPFEKFVVHGHSPVAEPDIRSNRVNIDTGAVQTGRLTCLIIEGSKTQLYTIEAVATDGYLEPRSSRLA